MEKSSIGSLDKLSCPSGRHESELLYEGIRRECPSKWEKNLTAIEKYFCNLRKTPVNWAYKHFRLSEGETSTKLMSPSAPLFLAAKNRQLMHAKDIWPCHRGVLTLVSYNTNDVAEKRC